MPAYDFRCTACAHVVEVRRSSSDDSPVVCPECGGTTKQIFHPVGVHFKGTGFHNTDYRKAPPSTEAGPSKDAAPSDASCPAASGGGCDGCPAKD